MAFMDMIDDLAEKCGLNRGDRMQYALVGLIILVIIFSAIVLVNSFTGGPGSGERGEATPQKYYCLKTEKEFELDLSQYEDPDERMMVESEYMGSPFDGYVPSPFTNEKTAVPMVKCPSCGEWYVPEAYIEMDPDMPVVCTECGTDQNEWYREKRRKSRK